MRKKSILLLALVLYLVNEVSSQSFYAIRRDRDVLVSVGGGTATYYGDLQNPNDYFDARPSVNIGAQMLPFPRILNNRITTRAELSWFRMKANDVNANDDRVERNLNFFSSNWELSTTTLFHVFPQNVKFYQRTFFNFYGFVGGGLLYSSPKTTYQGEKVALQPLQTEGIKYSKFHFVIPYGFGIKFKNGPFYNIAIEAGWRKTFTDYLDDVSRHRYLDISDPLLTSDLARVLSDRRKERDPNYPVGPNVGVRGNPKNMDSYMFANIKLEYYLPIDLHYNDRKLMTVKRKKYTYRRR